MSTPRIQVLLRPSVLSLVQQRAAEQGTTLSKTCAQLIEIALESQGLYDRKAQASPNATRSFSDMIAQAATDGGWKREVVARKTESLDPEDLELITKLKKLKALEAAGLL